MQDICRHKKWSPKYLTITISNKNHAGFGRNIWLEKKADFRYRVHSIASGVCMAVYGSISF